MYCRADSFKLLRKFKGQAKAFVRSYGFLAAILPYGNPNWEKLSIFLNFLIPKLPAPKEEDLSKGVLEAIDMDSYRVEAKASLAMALDDADAEIEPPPPGGGGGGGDPDIDKLSNIIKTFNDLFGNIDWKDEDKIRKVITEEIPAPVPRTRHIRPRRRTPINRTPSWSTTRRSTASCWNCFPITRSCSSSSATTPTSSAGSRTWCSRPRITPDQPIEVIPSGRAA